MGIVASVDFLDFVPWIGALLGGLALWAAMHARRMLRLVADTPTSKTTGVFLGMVELKGTAEAEQPVISYLSEHRCVHYSWSVTERWSRLVTETYTDSKGNTITRTRTESGWTTIDSGGEAIPFYLKDDAGTIRIIPEGAKIEALRTFNHTCRRNDPLYYAKAPPTAIAHSDHIRSFTEYAIPLHTQLYVMGMAREREDIVAAEIARDVDAPMFLISTRTEVEVRRGKAITYWAMAFLGMLLVIAGWMLPEYLERDVINWPQAALAGSVYIAVWFICWVWMVYNSLSRLNQRVNRAWSHIDVELRRRHDLIPQLVRVISGLRDHERTLQTEISHLRSQTGATEPGAAGPDPQACTRDLIAVAEAYPQLKSDASFLHLQQQLVKTEERIALARTYYNEIAGFFNTRLAIVPDKLIAKLGHFQPRQFMAAEGFERSAIKVALAD